MAKTPILLPKGFTQASVSQLIKAAWNYKGDDAKLQKKLTANLKKNGQVETIIVREHDTKKGCYEVVNGNHRLDSFKEVGLEKVMVFNLGKVPLKAAQRLAIETNDTRFKSDPIKEAGLFRSLITEFGVDELASTMPYDAGLMEDMASVFDFNWADSDTAPKGAKVKKKVNAGFLIQFNAARPPSLTKKEQILDALKRVAAAHGLTVSDHYVTKPE